jgi:hypothetical protein
MGILSPWQTRMRSILEPASAPPMHAKELIMSKSRHSSKEAKKQPLMTPKEKRAAKHQKKHGPDGVPIIVPH